MGITAAIAAVGAIGGVAAGAMMKPNTPNAPAQPDTISKDKMETMAGDREERARKKALGAYGRSDTILTDQNGMPQDAILGSQQQQERTVGKTLLGQ